MRCKEIRELLEEYLEGEIDETKRKEMETHIDGCDLCRWELALSRSIPRLVGSLSTPPVPDDLIPSTLKRLHEMRSPWRRKQGLFGILLRRRWRLVAATSILLALLLFGIGYHSIRRPGISEEEVASAVREAKFALGIVGKVARRIQIDLMEGTETLNVKKREAQNAIRDIAETQREIAEELYRTLAVLSRLKLKEVGER